MLILEIELYKSVMIGDDIKITVSDIHRMQVKLGVDAPDDVLVLREELLAIRPGVPAQGGLE